MNRNLIEQTIVVVAELFNPSVFNQYWFIKEGLLKRVDVEDEMSEIDFDAVVDTDGIPCIVLSYPIAPKRGFNRWN